MAKVKDIRISFRAPATLRDAVNDFIARDMHMNASDFFRDATREKIKNDAPDLYRKLFAKSSQTST